MEELNAEKVFFDRFATFLIQYHEWSPSLTGEKLGEFLIKNTCKTYRFGSHTTPWTRSPLSCPGDVHLMLDWYEDKGGPVPHRVGSSYMLSTSHPVGKQEEVVLGAYMEHHAEDMQKAAEALNVRSRI